MFRTPPGRPVLTAAFAIPAAVVFGLLVWQVTAAGGVFFDAPVYGVVSRCISQPLTGFVAAFTNVGDPPVLAPLAVVLFVALLLRGRGALGGLLVFNLGASALFNLGIKLLVQRPRPDVLRLVEETGYSFPSGHSFVSMAFYGLLIYLAATRLRGGWRWGLCAVLGVLVLCIGLSRIYLGVHYPSDVLAGFCGGFLWLALEVHLPLARRIIYDVPRPGRRTVR